MKEIARLVQTIQQDSCGTAEAIVRISTIIDRINETQTTIASAVEEQSVTTNEIGRLMGSAVDNNQRIGQSMERVASAAEQTNQGAGQTRDSANALDAVTRELQETISRFRF